MGFNFFEPLTQFCGLLRKPHSFCVFSALLTLIKLFYLRKPIFCFALLFQILFEGFIMFASVSCLFDRFLSCGFSHLSCPLKTASDGNKTGGHRKRY